MGELASLESKILEIRRRRVMLDADLAAAYGVETRRLNEQVRRNSDRFPGDFLFRLTAKEKHEVVANCDHLHRLKFARALPWAFTEHGAIMAATILNSAQAIAMSVYVVRAFVRLRAYMATSAAIMKRLSEIDGTLLEHDEALRVLWSRLRPLLEAPPDPPRKRIGFHAERL